MARSEEMEEEMDSSLVGFVKSTRSMLIGVKNKFAQTCSISTVPEQLRKSKVEAYLPKVVSIGPLHRGTRRELQYMEETKWSCTRSLLNRSISTKKDEQEIAIDEIVKENGSLLLEMNDMVRASYNVDDVKFNTIDLAKIMFLDCCFLLELLISGSDGLSRQLKCSEDHPSPGPGVIKREKVLSDLTLLENQIPLFVLQLLAAELFPKVFTFDDDIGMRLIHNLALSLLGYGSNSSNNNLTAFHFLQLVHAFIEKEEDDEEDDGIKRMSNTAQNDKPRFSINMQDGPKVAKISHEKLERCATMLQAAGIIIKAQSDNSNHKRPGNIVREIIFYFQHVVHPLILMVETMRMKGGGRRNQGNNPVPQLQPADIRFNLNVTFNHGVLEIPTLYITETTEAKWRNFIAWEVNRTDQEKLIDDDAQGGTRISCKFISYASFFQGLICSVHDIQLLRDKNIILVHGWERNKMRSNEDLLNLFRKITEGVPDDDIDMDLRFGDVIKRLNSYTPTVNRVIVTCRIVWHVFRRILTWIWYKWRVSYRILRRDYIPTRWRLIAVLAAAFGLGLTLAQTIFSARVN